MQSDYPISRTKAEYQVLLQKKIVKFFSIWAHFVSDAESLKIVKLICSSSPKFPKFSIVYGLFTIRMAMDHFGRAPSAPVFILKLILSINLYFSLFTSVNRIALLSLEISVASIFLANCLDSLKEKINHYIR